MSGKDARSTAHFRALRELGVLACSQAHAGLDALPEAPARPEPDFSHALSGHTPLWAYEHPDYATPLRFENAPPPVFEELDPASAPEAVLAKTRFAVFAGASPSPMLERFLAEPGVFVLICESDPARLGRFLERVAPPRLVNKGLVLLGPLEDFSPPLSSLLTTQHFALGFPVFYVPEDCGEEMRAYQRSVIECIEVLFYRLRIYPLSSQSLARSLPLRSIVQELFYDQLVHAYRNTGDYATCPDISALRLLFQGETAILVAAGADLANKIEFLRKNRDKALIIAVNSALRPLVEAGVKPHFTVVNDTSLAVDRTFDGLPVLRPVILVAHCLSCLGGETFPKRFLFGNHRPELFGTRPNLPLHGSVLTTAFSLARHLGCAACVLVGAQLSSADPWSLQYVTGQSGIGEAQPERGLINRYPQLYPTATPWGGTRYTSLNFLDVKHWMAEEFRSSGIRCVNTTRESIVYWEGVEFDEAPEILPTGRLQQSLRHAFAATRRTPVLAAARSFLDAETARLTACLNHVLELRELDDREFLPRAKRLLAIFDANNVSYLVQRYKGFNQPHFAFYITRPETHTIIEGLEYYFAHVCDMLTTLLALLAEERERVEALARAMRP